MYPDVSIWLAIAFVIGGLAALAWSSDTFVDGAAALAKALGISPFVIGMVIIGFGTSAPELAVSALSGAAGHSNLSLGNAYGSCIFNIAVILGVSALILPLSVKPAIAYVAAPMEAAIVLASMWLLGDGTCSRTDAIILLAAFAAILPAYCWFDQKTKGASDPAPEGSADALDAKTVSIPISVVKLVIGLAVLVGSSHFLVWGAVDLAKAMGVSDLVIGLTIVAVGTSLPELASAVASARRGEHEFILGNIVGSNLFNSLAVIGVATAISPLVPDGAPAFSPYIMSRDLPLLLFLTLSITAFGVSWKRSRKTGLINRAEAMVWLAVFVLYTWTMINQEYFANV